MLPDLDIGVVVLTNAAACGAAETLAREFLDLVEVGHVTKDWFAQISPIFTAMLRPKGDLVGKRPPDNPAPSGPLAVYAGTYANAYFGDVAVVEAGAGLHLKIGPAAVTCPLTRWDNDIFAVAPSGENAPDGSLSSVHFVRKDGAAATDLKIDYLDKNGFGRFARR
jgi:hypothetical protein